MNQYFSRIARRVTQLAGSPSAFVLSLGIIALWALSGPYFNFSDVWQLVINTGTTIITFLMVFLIQNTQNRDSRALHLKLDEIILAIKAANNQLIDIEDASDASMDEIKLEIETVIEKERDHKK